MGSKSILLLVMVVLFAVTPLAFAGTIVGWGTDVPTGNDYTAIAAGYVHSLALKSDGSIVNWGSNPWGHVHTPPAGNDYIAIAAGYYHNLALKSDGSIVQWGDTGYGQGTPPDGNDYTAISGGIRHSLALKSDGSIVQWGDNSEGQGTPPAGNDYIAIASGGYHNLALKLDGSIVGWGSNPLAPAMLPPDGNDYIAISAGYTDNLALKSDGSIVGGLFEGNDYIAISAGGQHYLAIATLLVADANGPYTVYVGDSLILDANGSTDADGDIISYLWDLDDDGFFETDAGDQPIFDVNYSYLESIGLLINHTYTIHLKVTDSEGQSDTADSTLIIVPKPAIKVAVDIKPGGCPNPVNTKSSGVLPVAILGSNDYDITTIDPASIRLAGVEPLRSGYEDVAGLVADRNDCNCIEAGPDGLLDLTLKFETQAIVEAIGDVNDGDVLTLELTGVLYDPIPFETPIEGADCILIKGKYKAHNKADINKDGVVDAVDFAIIAQNWLQSSDVD